MVRILKISLAIVLLGSAAPLLLSSAFAKETFSVLSNFNIAQGGNSASNLIADANGNLYGTLNDGGAQNAGAVFKLAPNGSLTILHTFTGGSDGGNPIAGLIEDANNNLYGTTAGGGSGYGVVYEITAAGQELVLYSFSGGSDGAYPWSGLVRDSTGNLYGTTRAGGDTNCTAQLLTGCGVVFKLAPNSQETVLYAFTGANGDGANPESGVIADTAGNLYGTTYEGGSSACEFGCGIVFELAPDGTETILHGFQGGSDGGNPMAGLVADGAGNFYGTTYAGGSNVNCERSGSTLGCGTVFEVGGDGSERVIHSFTSGNKGGYYPYSGLIIDNAGNLDGTTWIGGSTGGGTIFQLSPSGVFKVLHAFEAKQGANPEGGLLVDKTGNLYGTTNYYGKKRSRAGTAYELVK